MCQMVGNVFIASKSVQHHAFMPTGPLTRSVNHIGLRGCSRVRMFCALTCRGRLFRRTVIMARWIAISLFGVALAGCSSWSVPSFDTSMFKGSSAGVTVRAESNPSGAEARAQGGAACRTPCALELPANGLISVTFSLQGYLPQTLSVNVASTRESADLPESGSAELTRIDPNPVFAQLELAPPPPPPVRKKVAPRKPRPPPAAPPPPAQGFGPPAQPGFR
jgi:hypothetical protein